MQLVRIMLVLAALLTAYVAALPALAVPQLWLLYLVALVALACRRGHRALSSHGTARWADSSDLEGMTDDY